MTATVSATGGLVVREVAGQRAVGVDLGEQLTGLAFDGLDGIAAGDPSCRRVFDVSERHSPPSELRGIAALLAAHAGPCLDGGCGGVAVVLDRGLGVAG